jgi:ankyrin repeat protein
MFHAANRTPAGKGPNVFGQNDLLFAVDDEEKNIRHLTRHLTIRNILQADHCGNSALNHAVMLGQKEILGRMLEVVRDVRLPETPLASVLVDIQNGGRHRISLLALLLADRNQWEVSDELVRDAAEMNIGPGLLANLKSRAVETEGFPQFGGAVITSDANSPALLEAAANLEIKAVQRLIRHGVDVNAHDMDGLTPVLLAHYHKNIDEAQKKSIYIRSILLSAGAEVDYINMPDDDSNLICSIATCPTPVALWTLRLLHERQQRSPNPLRFPNTFIFCVALADINAVDYLLSRGYDPNQLDCNGELPLEHAGCLEKVDLLLNHGADIDGPLSDGAPLSAIASDSPQMIEGYLERGANIDAIDADGRTVISRNVQGWESSRIMYSNRSADDRMEDGIRKLIQRGADLTIQDHEGELPSDKTQNERMQHLLGAASPKPRFSRVHPTRLWTCAKSLYT